MASRSERRQDVLRDSEATLRQVKGVLRDLGADGSDLGARVEGVLDGFEVQPADLRSLVEILLTAQTGIIGAIGSLRRGRGLLERAAMERVQATQRKLTEVSSTTETAATRMLDSLERALALVDGLDDRTDAGARRPTGEDGGLREELRDEIHKVVTLLQFQDITAQQLSYATGVLSDIEGRMVELARILDLSGFGTDEATEDDAGEASSAAGQAYDPGASERDVEVRQAVADEIFS